MALLFCDSFDHYTTQAQCLTKWNVVVNPGDFNQGAGFVTWAAQGRNGTNGMRVPRGDGGVRKVIPGGAKATFITGVAFRTSVYPTSNMSILSLRDGPTTVQVGVNIDPSGRLVVTCPAGTYVGTHVLSLGAYNYIELKATINNTTGSFELRLNGATELSQVNIDTQATANASADTVALMQVTGVSGSFDYDDFYICDSTGTQNNDFLGDIRVTVIFPSAAGNYSQWTPLVGLNYTDVDESSPNDDTDYVSSSTVGQIDTYTFTDLTTTAATIKAIQWVFYARKDDAGLRQIAPVIRQGAADQVGATQTLLTTYSFIPVVFDTNPHTGAAFTLAEINGDEFGVKVIA